MLAITTASLWKEIRVPKIMESGLNLMIQQLNSLIYKI